MSKFVPEWLNIRDVVPTARRQEGNNPILGDIVGRLNDEPITAYLVKSRKSGKVYGSFGPGGLSMDTIVYLDSQTADINAVPGIYSEKRIAQWQAIRKGEKKDMAISNTSPAEFMRVMESAMRKLDESAKKGDQSRLEKLEKLVVEQDKELKRLAEESKMIGTVVGFVEGNQVLVAPLGQAPYACKKPTFKLELGDNVYLIKETGQILSKVKGYKPVGTTAVVDYVKDGMALIQINGEDCWINAGKQELNKGDRVVIDQSRQIILHNIGKTGNVDTGNIRHVTWDEIGGLDVAKQTLIDAIETPHQNKELYEKYGKKMTKGVLLYGDPGCGKTLLGKALLTSIARTHGGKDAVIPSTAYIHVKGAELLNKYVGAGEAQVRSIFGDALKHKKEHGYPALIFIDEAEALLGRRGESQQYIFNTMVPAFLSEMDGIEESGAIVVLATNRPDSLDPAVIRDGRIDYKIHVTRPTKESAKQIMAIYLKNVPLFKGETIDSLTEMAVEAFFDDKMKLGSVETGKGPQDFCLRHIANGAMLENIVEFAKQEALRRDIAAKAKKPSGVKKDDLIRGVIHVYESNYKLSHKDAVKDFKEANAA